MATLTSKQRKNIKAQLDAVQQKINDIKAARVQTALPTATSQPLTAAQRDGASGRGADNYSDETNEAIKRATEAGVPMSELGTTTNNPKKPNETYLDKPKKFSTPKLNDAQAGSFVKSFGLEGLVDAKSFAGLTASEANQRLLQERAKRTGQVSANTTFAFNPEILKRTQRAIDKFGFALNDVSNDPFEPKEFKDEAAKNTVEVTSKELGGLFESPDQLYAAYNTNQQFRDSFDKFVKKGGTLEGVSKNISGPVASTPLQQAQSELGGPNNQTPDQYLSDLRNPKANQEAEKIALEELAPESAVAQAEISRVANIPKELQTLYFGDEKTMGVLQMKQAQSVERIKLIEEQERDAKRTARNKAELQVERNKVEVERSKSQIEENRLAAKNYMTAQLAKLGALNTTGAAPLALQTLETKYQGQVSQLDSNFKLASREIEIGLNETIDSIENQADEFVLKIEEDITTDRETSVKEILKARQAAEKEVYRITEQYSRRLRERTTKYTDDLKKEAEKYAKEFAKNASNGLDGGPMGSGYSEGDFVKGKGVLLPNGTYAKIDLTPTQTTQVQSANLSGASTIRFFVSLPEKFRAMIVQEAQGGGKKFSSIDALKSRYAELKAEDEKDDEEDGDLY